MTLVMTGATFAEVWPLVRDHHYQRRPEFKAGWKAVRTSPKLLYVMPLRERRARLLSRFGWTPLPYPKPARAA